MSIFAQTPCDEGVLRCGRAAAPCSRKTGPWILTATIIASGMAIIDSTAVNIALPVLQKELNASVAHIQWIVESYALFLASLLLVGGSLGDRFGRRRIFLVGNLLFCLTSLWCGLAPGIFQLITARAAQGIGAALLMPGSLAIITASFPEDRRGRAIGTWAAFTAIAAALGPVLGGWLVENISWRWVFFINLPLGAVVMIITMFWVPESRDESPEAGLDWGGALLTVLGLGAIVFGLIESGHRAWFDPMVMVPIGFGALALIGFLGWESRTRSPMMPLHLFRSSTFLGANLLTLFLYAALGGALFFLPFNLIQVQGYSPTGAGAAMLPFILLLFLLSRWAGGLVIRYGARLPLTAGPLIAAVGYALFLLPEIGGSYWSTFFPAILVLGFGMAVSVAPLTTTVMNSVEVRYSGIASGINNAVARTAGLLAIALFGVLALTRFDRELDLRLTKLGHPPSVTSFLDSQRIKLAGAEFPAALPPHTRQQLQRAVHQSFVESFRWIVLLAAGLSLAGSASSYLIIQKKLSTKGRHSQFVEK